MNSRLFLCSLSESVAARALGVEAVTAIHRTIATGLERDLGGTAAAIADHVVHLALAVAGLATSGTARGAAGGAAAGLVLEALVGIELLLRRGENEFLAALTANQSLVFEHGYNPP